MNAFDPETGELRLTLPLPPPDNHTHRGGGLRFPTEAYKEWLRQCAPVLRETLGDWTPDKARWWEVRGSLQLGSQGDAQNYLKPTLDLLTGKSIADRHLTGPDGTTIATKGSTYLQAGLWDDDRRVMVCGWGVTCLRHPFPSVSLSIRPMLTVPRDWEAERRAQERAEREQVRAEEKAVRNAERAAEKERKAQERAQAKAEREAEKAAKRARKAGV